MATVAFCSDVVIQPKFYYFVFALFLFCSSFCFVLIVFRFILFSYLVMVLRLSLLCPCGIIMLVIIIIVSFLIFVSPFVLVVCYNIGNNDNICLVLIIFAFCFNVVMESNYYRFAFVLSLFFNLLPCLITIMGVCRPVVHSFTVRELLMITRRCYLWSNMCYHD